MSTTTLGGIGIALLALGFSLSVLVCFGSRSWAFSAEHVSIPCIIACLIGFLNVPYCFIISTRFTWNIPATITAIGSAVAAAFYTILYFIARRRLARSESSPPDRIGLVPRPSISSTAASYHTQNYFANHVANMYPAARAPSTVGGTPPDMEPLNEDELQRRHMSALLHKPESYVSPATSPFNRIEFNVDDTETPVNGYYAPTGGAATLSTRSFGDPSWRSRNASWVTNDSRRNSSREERRREIEMGR